MTRRTFLKSITVLLTSFKLAMADRMGRLGDFYFPFDAEFERLKEIFNRALTPQSPDVIHQSSDAHTISQALRHAENHQFQVRMRSGGHSFEGFSTGKGLVVDVRKLKTLEVGLNHIRAGAGLTLGELLNGLQPMGYTFPTGSCPSVGLAGFLVGGGHGTKARHLGLGADRVSSMSVTLANGERVKVSPSPSEHSDLYWALLGGGGGNFAIVDEFYLDLIPSYQEAFFAFEFRSGDCYKVFTFWEEWIKTLDSKISPNLVLSVQKGSVTRVQLFGTVADAATLSIFDSEPWSWLQSLALNAPVLALRSANFVRGKSSQLPFKASSQFAIKPIGASGLSHLLKVANESIQTHQSVALVFEPMGGQIQYPHRLNAYPHRDTLYVLEVYSSWVKSTDTAEFSQAVARLNAGIDPLFSAKSYVNYPDFSIQGNWAERYYGDSLEKLIEIKKKYDPKNIFDFGVHSLSQYLKQRKLS